MGMDVHGLNPKQNKKLSDFPVMEKFDAMDFSDKWKILEKDEKTREQYWEERDKWESVNPGVYFRNNVWWWRPLWNYCYNIAPDLVGDIYDSGNNNDGAGLNAEKAKQLGEMLMETIADGSALQYQVDYMQMIEDLPLEICTNCNGNNRGHKKMGDCKSCGGTGKVKSFDTHYPFDVDNVEEFAKFCIESGGFEIC